MDEVTLENLLEFAKSEELKIDINIVQDIFVAADYLLTYLLTYG